MRLTLGKTVRAYLYRVMLGTGKVSAIYQGGVKIWPTLSDTIASCIIDVASIEGTVQGAEFTHALKQISLYGAEAGRFIILEAGGRTYCLNGGLPGYDVATYDSGVVTFGDNGPCADGFADGDRVKLRLVIPAHESSALSSPSQNVGFEDTWGETWLPGTVWVYSHYKGQKKVCSWASGYVTGVQSGMRYFTAPWHNEQGHWRGNVKHTIQTVSGLEPSYADTAFRCHMEVGGSSGIYGCKLVFPAINSSFYLTVTAVTRHD